MYIITSIAEEKVAIQESTLDEWKIGRYFYFGLLLNQNIAASSQKAHLMFYTITNGDRPWYFTFLNFN